MQKKLEDLLMEFAKLDAQNRICANNASSLVIVVDVAIECAETTMFDLYAKSQEETARKVRSVLEKLKDAKKDAQNLVHSTKISVISFEKLVNALIWSEAELDDAEIERIKGLYKNSSELVKNTTDQIEGQIKKTIDITMDLKFIAIF